MQLLRGSLANLSKANWEYRRKISYLEGFTEALADIADDDPLEAAQMEADLEKIKECNNEALADDTLKAIKEEPDEEAPRNGTSSTTRATAQVKADANGKVVKAETEDGPSLAARGAKRPNQSQAEAPVDK